ncbi:hypothetical protein HDU97_002672 [Phlyctochytrium planicorne]|nr:hypothetical protein HDU97_002672 [Phlyctochytrium planicorne]
MAMASRTHTYRFAIVEDNPVNAAILKNRIKKLFNVHVADRDVFENGLKFVKALMTERYDLVFMDIDMPIMNGFDTARIIRGELAISKLTPVEKPSSLLHLVKWSPLNKYPTPSPSPSPVPMLLVSSQSPLFKTTTSLSTTHTFSTLSSSPPSIISLPSSSSSSSSVTPSTSPPTSTSTTPSASSSPSSSSTLSSPLSSPPIPLVMHAPTVTSAALAHKLAPDLTHLKHGNTEVFPIPDHHRVIPIIAVTSLCGPEEVAYYRSMGMDAVIDKGIETEELVRVVEMVLSEGLGAGDAGKSDGGAVDGAGVVRVGDGEGRDRGNEDRTRRGDAGEVGEGSSRMIDLDEDEVDTDLDVSIEIRRALTRGGVQAVDASDGDGASSVDDDFWTPQMELQTLSSPIRHDSFLSYSGGTGGIMSLMDPMGLSSAYASPAASPPVEMMMDLGETIMAPPSPWETLQGVVTSPLAIKKQPMSLRSPSSSSLKHHRPVVVSSGRRSRSLSGAGAEAGGRAAATHVVRPVPFYSHQFVAHQRAFARVRMKSFEDEGRDQGDDGDDGEEMLVCPGLLNAESPDDGEGQGVGSGDVPLLVLEKVVQVGEGMTRGTFSFASSLSSSSKDSLKAVSFPAKGYGACSVDVGGAESESGQQTTSPFATKADTEKELNGG